jgi:hypothetical protein
MIMSGQVTVGTAPTYIGQPSVDFMQIHIHNSDNTTDVFLGGSEVTTSTGLRLPKLDTFEIVVGPKDKIYAISSKQDHTVSYLMANV